MIKNPVSILASEVRAMTSKYTGRNYQISISLPFASYKSNSITWPFNPPLEKWPVVYLLDGNWYFGMVTNIVRNMGWFGNTTDAIIVGIGYPENENPPEALCDTLVRRFYDLSPVRDEGIEKWVESYVKRPVQTGGAADFLNFIKQELIPVVEQEFHADPQKRILAGHSLGGTFATFALFEEPDLFDTYIIGSPSLDYGDEFLFKREELFAREHKRLAARVHLWAGSLEEAVDVTTLADVNRFGAILESRDYAGFELVKQIFAELTHSEVIAPGFQAGLKLALKQQSP
jgi:uncharacterized protein